MASVSSDQHEGNVAHVERRQEGTPAPPEVALEEHEGDQQQRGRQHHGEVEVELLEIHRQRPDDPGDADDGEKVEHVRADDVAQRHVRLLADRRHDGGGKLGQRGAERHQREADHRVGHAEHLRDLGRAVDQQVGAQRKPHEAEHEEERDLPPRHVRAGFRLLGFNDETWIYTASVGKYYKSFWFNLRTFLTPSNNSVSQSYSFMTRYYLGGADDYLSIRVGTGLSPDNQTNNILYNNGNQYRLKSNNISLGFRKTLWATNVVFIETGLENQEYRQGEKGNQLTLGVGYLKRF